MAVYEHASAIGNWFFEALVESAKLRLMTFNEEAAHHNKPNSRVQRETRITAAVRDAYDTHDAAHVLILQGSHWIVDEAAAPQDVIHVHIAYPTGAGLGPYLRRPVPIANGIRAVQPVFPGSPDPTRSGWAQHEVPISGDLTDFVVTNDFLCLPETAVGIVGIDAGTDFKTSLVISHRWSNNNSTAGIGVTYHGGYLFWRTIGHVAAY